MCAVFDGLISPRVTRTYRRLRRYLYITSLKRFSDTTGTIYRLSRSSPLYFTRRTNPPPLTPRYRAPAGRYELRALHSGYIVFFENTMIKMHNPSVLMHGERVLHKKKLEHEYLADAAVR